MKTSPKEYAALLHAMLQKHPHETKKICSEFARLLVTRGEASLLPEIERVFEKQRDTIGGTIPVEVISARDIARVMPATFGGKKTTEKVTVDSTLIAGARVRIGDSFVDTTIARRLRNLKNAFQ